MKNKVFIVSLIATIISFSLYFANLKRVKNSSINIIEPKTSKTIPTKKVKEPKPKIKEPKIKTIEYANHVKVASGSQKKLAQKIEQIMGKDYSYQVAVQDLNNPAKFCRVANTKVAHNVDDTMKLYLLLAIYEQEQQGKLTSKTVIKVKKSDRVNGEKALKTNMSYGISFLRQAMMRGNKTAANALIRKVGHDKIDAIIKKLGADQTTMSANFSKAPYGKTTAHDLVKTMARIYQGRILNQKHASLLLQALNAKPNFVKGINGGVYAIGDEHTAVAIVQTQGHSYCMSVWSSNNKKFNELGKAINASFTAKKK